MCTRNNGEHRHPTCVATMQDSTHIVTTQDYRHMYQPTAFTNVKFKSHRTSKSRVWPHIGGECAVHKDERHVLDEMIKFE